MRSAFGVEHIDKAATATHHRAATGAGVGLGAAALGGAAVLATRGRAARLAEHKPLAARVGAGLKNQAIGRGHLKRNAKAVGLVAGGHLTNEAGRVTGHALRHIVDLRNGEMLGAEPGDIASEAWRRAMKSRRAEYRAAGRRAKGRAQGPFAARKLRWEMRDINPEDFR